MISYRSSFKNKDDLEDLEKLKVVLECNQDNYVEIVVDMDNTDLKELFDNTVDFSTRRSKFIKDGWEGFCGNYKFIYQPHKYKNYEPCSGIIFSDIIGIYNPFNDDIDYIHTNGACNNLIDFIEIDLANLFDNNCKLMYWDSSINDWVDLTNEILMDFMMFSENDWDKQEDILHYKYNFAFMMKRDIIDQSKILRIERVYTGR